MGSPKNKVKKPRAKQIRKEVALPLFMATLRKIRPDYSLVSETPFDHDDTEKVVADYLAEARKVVETKYNAEEAAKITDKGMRQKLGNLQGEIVGSLCIVDGKLAEKIHDETANVFNLPEGGREIVAPLAIEMPNTESKSLLELLAGM